MDKEEIIRRLKKISEHAVHVTGEPPFIISLDDGIALGEAVSMLKEQEEQKRKWLQNIADNQLSIGGADPLTEYEQGKWDGLQMAFEILTEER